LPKLPLLSGEELVKVLKRFGFVPLRQRGSHMTLKKETPTGAVGCVVPMHKEVAVGTLRSILRQAGLEPDTFIKNI